MSLNVSLQVLAGRTEMRQLSCLCPPVLQDLCSRRKQREEENESRDGEGGVREACDTSMREREKEREGKIYALQCSLLLFQLRESKRRRERQMERGALVMQYCQHLILLRAEECLMKENKKGKICQKKINKWD